MTENMNKFDKGKMALGVKAHGVGYKKGIATVKLAEELMARGVNVQNGQNEK